MSDPRSCDRGPAFTLLGDSLAYWAERSPVQVRPWVPELDLQIVLHTRPTERLLRLWWRPGTVDGSLPWARRQSVILRIVSPFHLKGLTKHGMLNIVQVGVR